MIKVPPPKFSHWGCWIPSLISALNLMNRRIAATAELRPDERPHAKDSVSGRLCLVDSRSTLSIWQQTAFADAKLDTTPCLKACNETCTNVWGVHHHSSAGEHIFHPQLHFGQPMIGWDTQKKHHISLASVGQFPIRNEGPVRIHRRHPGLTQSSHLSMTQAWPSNARSACLG